VINTTPFSHWFQREDTAEGRLDKLGALLSKATNDLRETTPLIADLLSIPTGDRYPALELTPQKRKEKTLTALVTQVEGLSRREPVLMVYEDFHWSDPTTREWLDLLIDRVSGMRVLVIITFRPIVIKDHQISTRVFMGRYSSRARGDSYVAGCIVTGIGIVGRCGCFDENG
jgi:predicted ATPase